MRELIEQFPQQLEQAMRIGREAKLSKNEGINSILVSGLGGSGIGGTIVSQLVAEHLKQPFLVNKGYDLPNWVDSGTLLIISSYSGNTEETIRVFEQALKTDANIVCISSGGKVIEMAREHGLDHIIVPGGMPPRACLGYSTVQQLFVLAANGLIPSSVLDELDSGINWLKDQQASIIQKSDELTGFLYGKLPVLYSSDRYESLLVRFRQQLNENSKMLCWHHVVPEMNHNELVGWRHKNEDLAVVWFRSKSDFDRCNQRIDLNREVIGNYTSNMLDVWSEGNNTLEEFLYFIHLGDWVSLFLAERNGFDPTEIDVINNLKSKLAEMAW
jgi:glucose/mannose-6-phosphate isomerase